MKLILKQTEKIIDKIIIENFSLIGFKKSKKCLFLKSLSNDIDLMIVLEKTDRRTRSIFYINPIVGLICKDVEKLYYELVLDIDISKDLVNTATESLGYLMPEKKYKTWNISVDFSEMQIQNVIKNLTEAIKNHALPFLEKFKDKENLLLALMEDKIGFIKTNYFKIAIIYYLLKKKEEGINFILDVLKNERPTPKVANSVEPQLHSYQEALDFFRQDKDVMFYYSFIKFYDKYKEL